MKWNHKGPSTFMIRPFLTKAPNYNINCIFVMKFNETPYLVFLEQGNVLISPFKTPDNIVITILNESPFQYRYWSNIAWIGWIQVSMEFRNDYSRTMAAHTRHLMFCCVFKINYSILFDCKLQSPGQPYNTCNHIDKFISI